MPNNKIIDLDRLSRFKDKLDNVLETKANVDGNYPTMTVGSADNLTPYGENSGVEESTPFVFQSAGGSSDISSQAQLRALRGNSVAFNQLIKNGNFADTSNWTAYGNTQLDINENIAKLTVTTNGYGSGMQQNTTNYCVKDHKYLIRATCRASASNVGIRFTQYSYGPGASILNSGNVAIGTNWTQFGVIATASNTGSGSTTWRPACIRNNGTSVVDDWLEIKDLIVIDLTLMFGAGNEPTSVLEFNRLFPKPYYDYNAGTLLSCKSNGYKTVGYNAFDGQWTGTVQKVSANFIKVIQGQTYTLEALNLTTTYKILQQYDENKSLIKTSYLTNTNQVNSITLENNTCYVKLELRFASDTNIPLNAVSFHLTWDESRTGYEPYESETYALPNVELRSAGSVYDELKPDGTLIRRVGVVDLGTLNWTASSNGYFVAKINDQKVYGVNSVENNMICSKYQTYSNADRANYTDKGINMGLVDDSSWTIRAKDTSISNDNPTTFKNGMSGVYLFYELATPTTEQTEYTFAETTPIDDYGTQEFLYDSDIAIPVPQGNDFFYPVDYKAFIDSLGGRDDIEYAADQVVSQTQLTQALSTFLSSIQGYDATKTQTLKNVNGVFQWVDD